MVGTTTSETETQGLVVIGAIERAFGVKGALCIRPLSDVPGRFAERVAVVLSGPHGSRLDVLVTSVRPHGNRLIVGVDRLTTPEAVAPFRGGYVYAAKTGVAAPAGHFFQCDLLGLSVENERGEPLGNLEQVLETPAHHIFVVRLGERELLVPAVREWVRRVDLDRRIMTVRVPEVGEPAAPASTEARHAV